MGKLIWKKELGGWVLHIMEGGLNSQFSIRTCDNDGIDEIYLS